MKVGIVGCGKQAAKHARALKKLNAGPIGICDIHPVPAREMAGQLQIAAYDSVDALLDDRSIDVIDICTPTPFHFPYARKALVSGRHVFCEKPLTVRVEEAMELRELTLRHQRLGMVAYVFKYHPSFSRAKEAVDAGVVGDLRAVYMRLGGRGSHRAWKHQAENGGGVVNEMMSHMLDLLIWFMGDVAEVEVVNLDNIVRSRRIDGRDVESRAEDFALVSGRGVKGTKFVVQSDLVSQVYTNQIELIGENGCIVLSIVDSQESYIFLNEERPPYARGKTPLASVPADLFELMFRDFFHSIAHREAPRANSFDDALRLAQLFSTIDTKGRLCR